jgi:hypothetical protein
VLRRGLDVCGESGTLLTGCSKKELNVVCQLAGRTVRPLFEIRHALANVDWQAVPAAI